MIMEKIKLIDLSRVLEPGRDDQPKGHPAVKLEEFETHKVNGRSNAQLCYSIHTGTHLDCPYHYYENDLSVDEMELERFFGRGIFIDLVGKISEKEAISKEKVLENSHIKNLAENIKDDDFIILYTGWEEKYATDIYYKSNPYISDELADWFVEKKIKGVALDFPPDNIPNTTVHRRLLGNGIIIIENLVNLKELRNKNFTLLALPIKLHGQGGSPARVVAMIE